MIRDRGLAGRRSLSTPGRASPDYNLQHAGDMVVLPPLGVAGKLSSKFQQSRALGGTEMWSQMSSLHLGSKPSRIRQWDLGGEDFGRQLDAYGDVGKTPLSVPVKSHSMALGKHGSPQKVAVKPRRQKSALGMITAAYLGNGNSEGGVEDMFDKLSALCSSLDNSEEDDDLRIQRELAGLQTGEDAVRYFARNGSNAKIKVLYCNRNPDSDSSTHGPYSLVVVPESKIHADHFTISANGVFHVSPGEMSECIPLSEWMHHSLMFSVLSAMPFFKMYSYRKNFGHWRASARYEAYCRQRQRLARSCLLAKPRFVQHVVNVHRLADEVKNIPVLQLARHHVRLDQFADVQSMLGSNPVTGARVQLARKHDAMLQVLEDAIKCVTIDQEELPAQLDQTAHRRSKSMVQEKQEARERARRKRIVEEDIAGLGKFIRLADLVLQSALVSVVVNATSTFRTRLQSPNLLFAVSASFNSKGVIFDPSQDVFAITLHRLWEHMVQTVSSISSLSTNSRLRAHAIQAREETQYSAAEILTKSNSFQDHVASIEDGIAKHLETALVYASEQYMPYHRIFEYGQEWNESAFAQQTHTIQSLINEIKRVCDFKTDMESFRLQRAVGLISVQGADLRESLNKVPERALTVMRQMLVKLAREQCARALLEVTAAIKLLEAHAQSREECTKLCKNSEDLLHTTDKLGEEVDEAYQLLQQTRSKVPVEDQIQLDVFQAKWHELAHTKLPQVKEYLATLSPDITVTIDASPSQAIDWSLTCAGAESTELAALRADLQQEVADGFTGALAGSPDVPARSRQTLGRIANARRSF